MMVDIELSEYRFNIKLCRLFIRMNYAKNKLVTHSPVVELNIMTLQQFHTEIIFGNELYSNCSSEKINIDSLVKHQYPLYLT